MPLIKRRLLPHGRCEGTRGWERVKRAEIFLGEQLWEELWGGPGETWGVVGPPGWSGVKERVREDGRSHPDSCHPRKSLEDRERLPQGSLPSGQGLASTYWLPFALVWKEQPSVVVWEKPLELCTQDPGSEATLPVGDRSLGHVLGVPVVIMRPDLQTDRED